MTYVYDYLMARKVMTETDYPYEEAEGASC